MNEDSEFPVVTLTRMWSDELESLIKARAPKEGFAMECHQNSEMFEHVQKAVNIGIDAHLEVIRFTEFPGEHGRRGFRFAPETLHVLVRRLFELDDKYADYYADGAHDSPGTVASDICGCLNIELI